MKEWLRDRMIHVLLDLLCLVLPQDSRFELIIEPEGDETMVAVLKKTEEN